MSTTKNAPVSKQVYQFELKTSTQTPYSKQVDDELLTICCELTIDFIERKFWIDMNNVLNTEKGVILLYGNNLFGNVIEKAQASSDTYKLLAEICEFAKQCIEDHETKSSYDPLEDDKVIELAFKFGEFLQKKKLSVISDEVISSQSNQKSVWSEFGRWLLPKKFRATKAKKYSSTLDEEDSEDLDDNK